MRLVIKNRVGDDSFDKILVKKNSGKIEYEFKILTHFPRETESRRYVKQSAQIQTDYLVRIQPNSWRNISFAQDFTSNPFYPEIGEERMRQESREAEETRIREVMDQSFNRYSTDEELPLVMARREAVYEITNP